jgi:hypothetical protein
MACSEQSCFGRSNWIDISLCNVWVVPIYVSIHFFDYTGDLQFLESAGVVCLLMGMLSRRSGEDQALILRKTERLQGSHEIAGVLVVRSQVGWFSDSKADVFDIV